MKIRQVVAAGVLGAIGSAAAAAGPIVEVTSLMPPHGNAPVQWLQRLAEAGAGPTRLASAAGGQPRVEELGPGPSGKPLLKVYAVLTRENDLLLPGPEGPRRYRASDRAGLAEFFARVADGGAAGATTPRGRFGLSEAEFTDLFTRLQTPLPPIAADASLREAVDACGGAARVEIEIDPAVALVLRSRVEAPEALARLTVGTGLAAALRDRGLALQPYRPIGSPAVLRVMESSEAEEPWPVGHPPEGSPARTAPVLMEFLTVEVEGYTLAEAVDALAPRLTWRDGPLPIVWDRFAMRSAAIDPAKVAVRFPSRRTFYKKLLDQLSTQARLRVELRVDEAGTPLLVLTR